MQMKNHEKVIKSHSTQLVRYDAMCRAIQSCEEYDEVKEIRDRAVALEVYAAQAMNMEAERSARVIRIRAERRAGQMLKEGKKKGHIAILRQRHFLTLRIFMATLVWACTQRPLGGPGRRRYTVSQV